jgi:hypothetical protein
VFVRRNALEIEGHADAIRRRGSPEGEEFEAGSVGRSDSFDRGSDGKLVECLLHHFYPDRRIF